MSLQSWLGLMVTNRLGVTVVTYHMTAFLHACEIHHYIIWICFLNIAVVFPIKSWFSSILPKKKGSFCSWSHNNLDQHCSVFFHSGHHFRILKISHHPSLNEDWGDGVICRYWETLSWKLITNCSIWRNWAIFFLLGYLVRQNNLRAPLI